MGCPTPWEPPAERRVRPRGIIGSAGRSSLGPPGGNHAKGGEKCLKTQGKPPAKRQVRMPRPMAAGRTLSALTALAAASRARLCLTDILPSQTQLARRRKTSRSSYRSSALRRGFFPGAAAPSKGSTPSGLSTANFLIATSNCTTCGRRECSRTGSTLPAGRLRGADRPVRLRRRRNGRRRPNPETPRRDRLKRRFAPARPSRPVSWPG